MYPPSHICRALYDLHPQLRLAWEGWEKEDQEELNAGSFCVVQLYHILDCGDLDDPLTFREFWHVSTRQNSGGGFYTDRCWRGPLFNKQGEPVPDYDQLIRIPVFVARLKDYGVSTQQVYDGSFLEHIKQWLKPIVGRIEGDAMERGRDLNRHTEDIADQMTDHLWFEANKTEATGPRMARKHAREEMRLHSKQAERTDLTQSFMPPAAPSTRRTG